MFIEFHCFTEKLKCYRGNVPPALVWTGAPEGTKSFVLTIHDKNAPTGLGWMHWVVANIPATAKEIPGGIGPDGANLPVPSEPIVFLKATTALCGPNDDTVDPQGFSKLNWEVELGIVIGKKAKNISEKDAPSHIAGYCVANDVSERAFQMQSAQWDKGNGCDTVGPIGPRLVTRDEVPDPQALDMWLDVNGERMQTGNTKTMIFGVNAIVSYVSRFMTLMPGNFIATGTPPQALGWE